MNSNLTLFAATVAPWISDSFPIIRIVILSLLGLLAIVMVILVMLQSGTSENMGAITGQSSDTYYSKNKAKSLEGTLKKCTIAVGIAMAALCILFFISIVIYPAA